MVLELDGISGVIIMAYKFVQAPWEQSPTAIQRLEDGAFIPFDIANTDYQEYLKWLDQGNTTSPAHEAAE